MEEAVEKAEQNIDNASFSTNGNNPFYLDNGYEKSRIFCGSEV